ncbi:MAG: hypothetical protein AAGH38_03800 [Pseudomonadota bacterium]
MTLSVRLSFNYWRPLLISLVYCICLTACDAGANESFDPRAFYYHADPVPVQEGVCDFWDDTDRMLEFWVGIRDFQGPDVKISVPYEYARVSNYPRYSSGTADGSATFRVRFSDFAPLTRAEELNSLKSKTQVHGTITIDAAFGEIEEAVLSRRVYETGEDLYSDISSRVLKERFGLFQLPKRGLFASYDIFVSVSNNNALEDFIRCTDFSDRREPGAIIPHDTCHHHMSFKDINISINYHRSYLSDWKRLRKSALEFFECAYVETSQAS